MKKALSFLLTAAMIMSMLVFPVSAADTHTHCWCVGADTVPADHSCNDTQEWTAVEKSGNTYTVPESGYYYLNWTGEAAKKIVIGQDMDVVLCLNGASIRAQTCINMNTGAELTICDCKGTGIITTTKSTPVPIGEGCTVNLMSGSISGTYGKSTSCISVKVTGGTFNMYGGNIKDGCINYSIVSDSAKKEGGPGCNINVTAGTVNMYGGTVSGGVSTSNGGNIDISGGTFNMNGGTVSGGTATSNGGNISVSGGTFTMNGGTVSGGNATTYGGNISVADSGTATINNGIIEDGVSTTHGGNISVLSGSFTMHAGTVSNGKSGTQGGNISAAGGTVSIKGGSVTGGQSGLDETSERRYGGNISVNNNGNLFVEGGTVSGGSSPAYGGNIAVNDADSSVTVSGATLSGGEAGTYGGSIGVNGGTVTVSNAAVTGGQSGTFGGNIGVNSGSVTISGTETAENTFSTNITDGQSTTYGGNIGMVGGTVILQSSKVAEGQAGTHGGNIGMGSGSMTMTDSSIENGTAVTAAGMSMQNSATASITGGQFVDCGIYFNTNGNLTLGGDAVLEIYHTGEKTGVLQLDETNIFTGLCGITMKTPGQFLATETDHCANFVSHVSGYGVAFTGTAMTLKAYTAKVGTNSYILLQDAIDNAEGSYVKLLTDVTEDVVINNTVYMDLNGKVLTSNITGTGTLCGMDNSGDTYVTPAGRIEGTVSCQIADHIKTSVTGSVRRYAAIADETGYTFHRYYMGITHISLKPGVTGVGYKAVFHADEQVQALLAEEGSFGYILQLDGYEAQTCALDQFTSGKTVTLRLTGIDVENFGTTAIKGKVFMKFGDEVIESGEYSYTMKDMVETAADCVAQLTTEQMTALQKMCNDNSKAMEGWDIAPILAWTAPAE